MLQVLMQMKNFSLIALLLLAFAAASCEFDFEVRNDADPGIYMSCVSDADSAMVYVSYASRLGVNAADIPKLVVNDAEFTVAGRKQPFDLKGETLCVKYPAPVHEGDRIGIKMSCEGLGSVEASTVLPAEFTAVDLSETEDEVSGVKIFTYELSLDRQPLEGEYVALSIFRLYSEKPAEQITVHHAKHLSPMVNNATDPTLEVAKVDFDLGTMKIIEKIKRKDRESQKDSIEMTIVPARAFVDGKIKLTVMDMSGVMPPQATGGPVVQQGVITTQCYIVRIFGVSEDFYRYCLAHYKSKNDFLAQMGLAPAQFAWSNVKGGFGFCGAVRMTETVFEPILQGN